MINEIKELVGISKAANLLQLPAINTNGRGRCPFTDCQSDKQFRIWNDRYYRCYKCDRHGSVLDFVMEQKGIGLSESLSLISSSLDISVGLKDFSRAQKTKQKAWDLYQTCAHNNLPIVESYCQSRGWKRVPEIGLSVNGNFLRSNRLSEAQLDKAGLLSRNGDEYFNNHIIFPIYDALGNLVHFHARNLDKNASLRWLSSGGTPGSNRYFYNSKALYQRQSSYIVICEGVSDCLSLLQLDIPAIGQFGVNVNLVPHQEAFSHFDGIIAVYDCDKHAIGSKKSNDYKSWGSMLPNLVDLMSLSKTPIYYLMPPDEEGITDINDWLVSIDYSQVVYAQYGKEHLKPLVDLAIELYEQDIKSHNYIWSCLAVDQDQEKISLWKNKLVAKYGSLENYLLKCHE
jgi:hypothetical protein